MAIPSLHRAHRLRDYLGRLEEEALALPPVVSAVPRRLERRIKIKAGALGPLLGADCLEETLGLETAEGLDSLAQGLDRVPAADSEHNPAVAYLVKRTTRRDSADSQVAGSRPPVSGALGSEQAPEASALAAEGWEVEGQVWVPGQVGLDLVEVVASVLLGADSVPLGLETLGLETLGLATRSLGALDCLGSLVPLTPLEPRNHNKICSSLQPRAVVGSSAEVAVRQADQLSVEDRLQQISLEAVARTIFLVGVLQQALQLPRHCSEQILKRKSRSLVLRLVVSVSVAPVLVQAACLEVAGRVFLAQVLALAVGSVRNRINSRTSNHRCLATRPLDKLPSTVNQPETILHC